jgi:hypothetical protein
MTSNNKIINLKLDAQTIEKLTKQKSIQIESLKPGELVSWAVIIISRRLYNGIINRNSFWMMLE